MKRAKKQFSPLIFKSDVGAWDNIELRWETLSLLPLAGTELGYNIKVWAGN